MMRIGVVDRSASVRGLLRRVVEEADGLEVAFCSDQVVDGLTHLEKHRVDVLILGLHSAVQAEEKDVHAALSGTQVPVLVLAPRLNGAQWDLANHTLDGQQDCRVVVLPKPNRPQGWEQLRSELPTLMNDLGRDAPEGAASGDLSGYGDRDSPVTVVAIGASAGGPVAVRETLQAIGERLRRLAVLIVQHIDGDFVDGLVSWLSRESRWGRVALARHGDRLTPGGVVIAPPEAHLVVSCGGVLALDYETGARNGHRPSVDILFESLARSCPAEVAGILLSGMGEDGADGLLALRRAGALTFAQNEASSPVFGMPRSAVEKNAAHFVLSPTEIGLFIRDVHPPETP